MKVTVQEEFGVRCLMQLTRAWLKDEPLSTTDIAEAEGISPQFAGKILTILKDAGLVVAARGRNGGFSLSRSPEAVMLDEALTILGGRLFSSEYCETHTGQLNDCIHSCGCSLRPVWGSIELIVSSLLRRISLSDLLENEGKIRESLNLSIQEATRQ